MFNSITKPVYRLVGEDVFLIEKAVNSLKELCGNQMPDLNHTVFNDENFSADKVIASCNQMPILDEKRFVLVKDISKISEEDKKKLSAYIKTPSNSSILVIVDTNKIFTMITPDNINGLSVIEIKKHIQEVLLNNNKTINADALEILLENCGTNLNRINSELSKILSYSKDENIITADIVNKLVIKTDEYNVFELSEALSKKQGDRAVKLLSLMLENSEPTVILGLIANHFRRLFHSLISKDTPEDIAKLFGVKEFAIVKARQQAKNFSATNLKKINETILEVDYMIKSGQMNATNAMYFLIFNILEISK